MTASSSTGAGDGQTAAMQAPLLRVEGLSTSFYRGGAWRRVLNGISFDVNARETVAVVGESGSGKSVTSLSIMRLLPPQTSKVEGKILWDGNDLLRLSQQDMKRILGRDIAMVFQEPMTSLNPVLTVGEQIGEVLMAHRGLGQEAATREAATLLEKVRIPAARSRVNDYPHEFSGGMRQRVVIAMALACRPRLLIADEPTTALDVTVQAQVLELLRQLQREEEMAILFITHDMGVVAEMADRTVVMYRGDVVEVGDSAQIFSAPRQPYTRALLSAVPRLGAMGEATQPTRFPVVDRDTGIVASPVPSRDTVRRDAPPVLSVSNLVTRFDIRSPLLRRVTGRVHAVENVSFELRAGETLSLVGESGCGKSTTARSVMRLLEPRQGSVMLDGESITDKRGADLLAARRKIQMIFQDPYASLNPRLRVGDAIAEPLRLHGRTSAKENRAVVADLLQRVGLDPDMAERFPFEFSGGQRQRICVARALALNPKVIIADEAVSSLDVTVKAQVINLMLDLQEQFGLSYLFVSHDMAAVERVSHRVAVMYLGEIVEMGPRSAIFSNPQHPYTRRLLAAVPVADVSRKLSRPPVPAGEIKSPIRPANYVPPAREYMHFGQDHIVQKWAEGDF